MKNILQLVVVLFLTSPFSAHSQLKNMDYANCQLKTFRINKMITLTRAGGSYALAVEQLKKDSLEGDFEYYLSKSLFNYTVYGKQHAHTYLSKKLENGIISNEEHEKAKTLLALITDNTVEYKRLRVDFSRQFPHSMFSLEMRIKDYLLLIKKSLYDRDESKEQQLFHSIDSLLSLDNLSDFDRVFFSIAKLDIQKNNFLVNKNNNKFKKALSKLAKKYPAEFWEPYLPIALGKESSFFTFMQLTNPYVENPSHEEKENWTSFYHFLNKNPFFDETKLSMGHGFPTIYYPPIETETELYIALNVMDSLVVKYPGVKGLKNTKLLIIEVYKDLFSDNDIMAYQYLSTLIDQLEHKSGPEPVDGSIFLNGKINIELVMESLSHLSESSIPPIRKQFERSLQIAPDHENLLWLKMKFDLIIPNKN